MSSDVDEQFQLTVTVPDEEAVLELSDSVDDVLDVRLVNGKNIITSPQRSTVWVDIGTLTPKQLAALELAFDEGYYDQPRSVDLETLADDLSVSKSAVSQRLRSAEATLVDGVLEAIRTQRNE